MTVAVDERVSAVADLVLACLDAACDALIAEEGAFCALDRAIGDGDHGTNLSRAARALQEAHGEMAALPPAAMLELAGTIVVMRVGGASGPLYGSLLMAIGRAWAEPATLPGVAAALAEGVAAVGRRGKAEVGAKTMLDVLSPAANALRAAANGAPAVALVEMVSAAEAGLESTRPIRATRGRAAFVGQRAIGHLDPGAASACLCIRAVARTVTERLEAR